MNAETTYTIYGIKNCDTVRKALRWLDDNNVLYTFHDYKSKGITGAKLEAWINQVGFEALINKKGLTWKQLPDEIRSSIKNKTAAVALMKEKTSVIKRPLVEKGNNVVALGFDATEFNKLLEKKAT